MIQRPIIRILDVCRGRVEPIRDWGREAGMWWGLLGTILLGAGIYGATIGLWRAPRQGLYTALKFPLLLLVTLGLNWLLNGMLAQLMGSDLSFRESGFALLMAFAVTAVLLASLAPVSLFVLWSTPPLSGGDDTLSHNTILIAHVGIIALAGAFGTLRLQAYLRHRCGSHRQARRILTAWLGGFLFLGCQLSWLLRPFIGSPGLPVQLLRPDAFQGNFYETTWRALINLVT